MKFLLDTDHVSCIQRKTEPEYSRIRVHAVGYSEGDIAYSIVSFHEQTIGAHAFINAARRPGDVVRGYEMLGGILDDFSRNNVVPYDADAAAIFDRLSAVRAKVGTMDLRIASTALSRGMILLTRNVSDFQRVPDLLTDDWTS
jgi:tRNA(fMet)-specific endonuclease VapC